MDHSVFNITNLAPRVRPSVSAWLHARDERVYIGRASPALRGSGYSYQERTDAEHTVTKYIHFSDVAQMGAAIAAFGWRRGVVYDFGYHVGVLSVADVNVFCGKLVAYMQRCNVVVEFERTTHMLFTAYLQSYICTTTQEIDQRRATLCEDVQMHVFVGEGTAWHDHARETTASFTEIAQALDAVGLAGRVSRAALLDALECVICDNEDIRAEWQSRYRARILQSHETAQYLNAERALQPGAVLWLGLTEQCRDGQIRGPRCLFELRGDRAVASFEGGRQLVPLAHVAPTSAQRGLYSLHPGLMRAEAIVSCQVMNGAHTELRATSSERPGAHSAHDHQVTIPSVCLSCARIVPALSDTQLVRLRNPEQMLYVLEELHVYPKPCCIETMMSPLDIVSEQIDAHTTNVNPAWAPEVGDSRKVVYTSRMPQKTPFLEPSRVLWTSEGSTAEFVRTHTYMCRYNYPQCSLEDYRFIAAHPTGTMDHMMRYVTEGASRALNQPPAHRERPKGNLHVF